MRLNCSDCKRPMWLIGDTGIMVCTACDMGPMGIPRSGELHLPAK